MKNHVKKMKKEAVDWKYLQATFLTQDQYLEYKISQSLRVRKQGHHRMGKRHGESFYQGRYTDGKYTHKMSLDVFSHQENAN